MNKSLFFCSFILFASHTTFGVYTIYNSTYEDVKISINDNNGTKEIIIYSQGSKDVNITYSQLMEFVKKNPKLYVDNGRDKIIISYAASRSENNEFENQYFR